MNPEPVDTDEVITDTPPPWVKSSQFAARDAVRRTDLESNAVAVSDGEQNKKASWIKKALGWICLTN